MTSGPEEYQPEEDDEETTGATSSPLADPPGAACGRNGTPRSPLASKHSRGPYLKICVICVICGA
jgi:hypothetical protein